MCTQGEFSIPPDVDSYWIDCSIDLHDLDIQVSSGSGLDPSNAEVSCWPAKDAGEASWSSSPRSARTNPQGLCRLKGLSRGRYSVRAAISAASDGEIGKRIVSAPVDIELDGTTSQPVRLIVDEGSLAFDGIALKPNGLPATSGMVYMRATAGADSRWQHVAAISKDGSFAFSANSDQNILVFLRCPTERLVAMQMLLSSTTNVVNLAEGLYVSVGVANTYGKELVFRARLVDASGMDFAVDGLCQQWMTRHLIGPLPEGMYKVKCSLPGGAELEADWWGSKGSPTISEVRLLRD